MTEDEAFKEAWTKHALNRGIDPAHNWTQEWDFFAYGWEGAKRYYTLLCPKTGNPCLTDTWKLDDPPNCRCGSIVRRCNRETHAIRTLMNCYNLGGWTDALSPMKRALAAEEAIRAIDPAHFLLPENAK